MTEDPERVQQLKEEMRTLIREFLEGMEQLGFSRAQATDFWRRTVGMTRSV